MTDLVAHSRQVKAQAWEDSCHMRLARPRAFSTSWYPVKSLASGVATHCSEKPQMSSGPEETSWCRGTKIAARQFPENAKGGGGKKRGGGGAKPRKETPHGKQFSTPPVIKPLTNSQNFPQVTPSETAFGGSLKMVSKGPSSRGFAPPPLFCPPPPLTLPRIFVSQLSCSYPHRGGNSERGKMPSLAVRDSLGGILGDNLGEGNCERKTSRCVAGPLGVGAGSCEILGAQGGSEKAQANAVST